MAKLIRCPSGHVYDGEAHASCPECAPTEAAAESGATTRPIDDGGGGGKRGMPMGWLAAGGATAVAFVAAGFLLSRGALPEPEEKKEPAEPELNFAGAGCEAAAAPCTIVMENDHWFGASQ